MAVLWRCFHKGRSPPISVPGAVLLVFWRCTPAHQSCRSGFLERRRSTLVRVYWARKLSAFVLELPYRLRAVVRALHIVARSRAIFCVIFRHFWLTSDNPVSYSLIWNRDSDPACLRSLTSTVLNLRAGAA